MVGGFKMLMKDNYIRQGIVTYISDGDTFDADIDLGFHVYVRERFRINGIDAPELKGPERPEGLKSKKFLVETILDKTIYVHSLKRDGFRRWLADVYFMDANGSMKSIADVMFQKGLTEYREYSGR
jgi:micrococcal nuclease